MKYPLFCNHLSDFSVAHRSAFRRCQSENRTQMALGILRNSKVSTSGRGRRRLASKNDIFKASEELSSLGGIRRNDF